MILTLGELLLRSSQPTTIVSAGVTNAKLQVNDMSDEDYYALKRVSHSSLWWYDLSPQYFKEMMLGIRTSPTTKACEFGSALHMYILERDKFNTTYHPVIYNKARSMTANINKFITRVTDNWPFYHTSPEGDETIQLPKQPEDYDDEQFITFIKACYMEAYACSKLTDDTIISRAKQLFIDFTNEIHCLLENKGKVILPPYDHHLILNFARALRDHPLYETLFTEYSMAVEWYNEVGINWVDKYTSLACKAKLDRLVIDHDEKVLRIIDVKTTAENPKGFIHSVKRYHYDTQLAFYLQAVADLYPEYKRECYLVVCHKTQELAGSISIFKVEPHELTYCEQIISNIMTELAWQVTSNNARFACPSIYDEPEKNICPMDN